MARLHKERRVEQLPPVTHYKPAGVFLRNLSYPACEASTVSRNEE
ncbi:hypothetical protein Salpa_4256 [Sporomusa sp. KB1]|nr:hypothetical protein Salpa_4256 [Sporomusa sp. KB1]